jgi:hypothetical protein
VAKFKPEKFYRIESWLKQMGECHRRKLGRENEELIKSLGKTP